MGADEIPKRKYIIGRVLEKKYKTTTNKQAKPVTFKETREVGRKRKQCYRY